jgi:hypothetical protein
VEPEITPIERMVWAFVGLVWLSITAWLVVEHWPLI